MERLTLQKRLALLLVVLVAPFAGVSAAGLIDYGNQTINSVRDAASQAKDTASVNENASVRASASVQSKNASSTPHGNNSANGAINGEAGLHATDNAAMNRGAASSTGGVDLGNGVNLTREDLANASSSGRVVTASEVYTPSDLQDFARTELHNDSNVTSMDFENDHLGVGYDEPGRLLGFIPMNLSVNVVANQDGTVTVSYPWYSFLVMSDRANLTTAIQNEVDAYLGGYGPYGSASSTATSTASSTAALNATTTAFANANVHSALFSPSVMAELADRIIAILRTYLVSGSGTASSTQTINTGY